MLIWYKKGIKFMFNYKIKYKIPYLCGSNFFNDLQKRGNNDE